MGTRGSVKTTLAISASLVSGAPTEAKYTALTFSPCGEVTNLGEFGPEYEVVKLRPISGGGTKKYKGGFDQGSLPVELLFDSGDAGQTVLEAAASSRNKYAVRVSFPPDAAGDVETYYFQALVTQLKRVVGGSSDAIRLRAILEIDETAVIRSGVAPPATPGGAALTVKNDGAVLQTDAEILNFTGAGVTATGAGAEKTINIPGAQALADGAVTLAKLAAAVAARLLPATGLAAGDIVYRTATAWARLAKGTNGQILSLVSGLPAWANVKTVLPQLEIDNDTSTYTVGTAYAVRATTAAITPRSSASKFLLNAKGIAGSIIGQARGDAKFQRKIGTGNWADVSGGEKNYAFFANFGNPPWSWGEIEDSPATTDPVQYRVAIRRGTGAHNGTWNSEFISLRARELL